MCAGVRSSLVHMHDTARPDTLRLFIGCAIDRSGGNMVERTVRQATWAAHWRMIEPASWHVTALFIGDVPQGLADRAQQAVADEACANAPIVLHEGRLQSMPPDAPTMRWIRFLPNAALTALHTRLAHRLSLPPSQHDPFWPHITLARARAGSRHHLELEGQLALPRLVLDSLSLFRSDPGPDGRTYRPVFTRPFSGHVRAGSDTEP
jgi:2'-5' RNA ligase